VISAKDITFWAGLRHQWLLSHGTPEELTQHVKHQVSVLRQGGGSCPAVHNILADVPVEHRHDVLRGTSARMLCTCLNTNLLLRRRTETCASRARVTSSGVPCESNQLGVAAPPKGDVLAEITLQTLCLHALQLTCTGLTASRPASMRSGSRSRCLRTSAACLDAGILRTLPEPRMAGLENSRTSWARSLARLHAEVVTEVMTSTFVRPNQGTSRVPSCGIASSAQGCRGLVGFRGEQC